MNIFIMDLLCMTPQYDRLLVKALGNRSVKVTLGSISFHLDTTYFKRNGVPMQAGIIDIVAHMGISHKTIRQWLKILEYVLNIVILRLIFIVRRPDIIHIQWIPLIQETSLDLWFLRSLQKQGAKIFYTIHNTLPHDSGSRFKARYQKLYETADMLICHTEAARAEIVEQFGITPQKVQVIPFGALLQDPRSYSAQEAKALLKIPSGKTVVLMFGLLRPYKGAEFLLEVWKQVIGKDGNTLLVIAGNGDPNYIAILNERIAELHLNDNVRTCFNYIHENEVAVYYSAADILVYPYKEITHSGALLTGMSFGKAIVASSQDHFIETLENGRYGMLVPYGNAELFADTLVSLIKEPRRRAALGDRVAEVMRTRYSWETIAARTVACYRLALDRS
jgi:glycosyltransferase involved in cell wall biosynthesis